MSNPILRTIISEMVETYLEESSSDEKYRRAIHTGELPKSIGSANKKTTTTKSFDEIHHDVKSIPNAKLSKHPVHPGDKRPGRTDTIYHLHPRKSSLNKFHNVMKSGGWKATGDDKFDHPDGHFAHYDRTYHKVLLSKKH